MIHSMFARSGALLSFGLSWMVAQISNLLYRRFPIREPFAISSRFLNSLGQPAGSRRYSRLETCATPPTRGSHATI
ncbi:MAG: hypothetical protein C5B50_01150 [Verrucomicrobia bacterium]|nr:MAG: hypothetical protein C5B50_01150 [Verrucomicrobiota bacterium]